MRKEYMLILAAVIAVALIPSDASAWCDVSYYKRVPINISTPANLTNYQIPFNLTYDADMNANFSDILYCDKNDIVRPFWVESQVNSAWAYVWINASVNNTNGTQGYFYFGNPTATSQSSATNTFAFYDDFSSATLDWSKWGTPTGGYSISGGILTITTGSVFSNISISSQPNMIVEVNMSLAALGTTYTGLIISNETFMDNTFATRTKNLLFVEESSVYHAFGADGTTSSYNIVSSGVLFTPIAGTYYTLGGVVNSTHYVFTKNVTTKVGNWTGTWSDPFYILLGYFKGSTSGTTGIDDTSIDWVRARKYSAIEPTVSIGAKEIYGAVPTITSPASSTYYTANQTLNFTVSGVNATYPCWKTIDGVITSFGNVANNTANASTITLNNSAHTVSVTCFGGSPSDNGTTTVTPTVIYSELRAKNAVGGAAINTFTANFSNGTSSTILYTTAGLIQTPLDALPQGAVNLTVTADGFGLNNTINYTINSTNFFNTSVNMNAASVAIYIYDEKTPTNLLSSNITFANSSTSKTWNNVNNISQLYSNLTMGDTTITIASTGYETRHYYLTITAQTLVNMSAYLLATASGQTVRWHVVTSSDIAIYNALVTAQKSISGSYVTVEQGYTDTSGTSTMFLDPTATYQIIVTHPDYNSFSSTIQPSSADYKIYLSTSNLINYTHLYDDINVQLSPLGYIPNNATNQTFSFYISSSGGTLTSFGINATDPSGALISSSTVTTSPSGGTVYIYTPMNQSGFYNVTGWFIKSGYPITVLEKKYSNNVLNSTNTSVVSILTEMEADNTNLGFKSRGLIAIFATLAATASVAYITPVGGGILGLIVLGIFTFVFGWIALKIFVLTALVVIAVIYIQGRI